MPLFLNAPETFKLATQDKLLVGATAGADVVLRTLGACLVGALAVPKGYNPIALRKSLPAFAGQTMELKTTTRARS